MIFERRMNMGVFANVRIELDTDDVVNYKAVEKIDYVNDGALICITMKDAIVVYPVSRIMKMVITEYTEG